MDKEKSATTAKQYIVGIVNHVPSDEYEITPDVLFNEHDLKKVGRLLDALGLDYSFREVVL